MDTLSITIIFIILSTIIGAFVRGRIKDRCLADFVGNPVFLEQKDGKIIWGILNLEPTGLELKYQRPYLDEKDNQIETSFVLYKNEYPNLFAILRYPDKLSEVQKKKRSHSLKVLYHPKGLRRLKRKMSNFCATVRDSLVEVINLFLGRVKSVTPAGKILSGQDKYVSSMRDSLLGGFSTSYEPLLEKYLGKKVILELSKQNKIIEYAGILKDYTREFIELMDVNYRTKVDEPLRKCDLIVPRKVGIIRHLGE